MLRLATADDPDVALRPGGARLGARPASRVGDIAARPRLGPVPITAGVGGRLTAPNHGLLRSAFSGQGNGDPARPLALRVLAHATLTLNPRRFRDAHARAISSLAAASRGSPGRRSGGSCRQSASRDAGGRTFLVANMHCTSYATTCACPKPSCCARRGSRRRRRKPEDVVVLAGDFNVTGASPALEQLAGARVGLLGAGPRHRPHPRARRRRARRCAVWPRRAAHARTARLLSDHAPVEVEIG